VLAVILTALVGFASTGIAAERRPLWSSREFTIEYADGSAYDYVFATGVSTEEKRRICGLWQVSPENGTVVRYHCYPIPE
jgi:hypothetical protein